MYHEQYNFNAALKYYSKFLKKAANDNLYINFAERMVKTCKNAKNLLSDSLDIKIQNIGTPINSIFSEYSPFISADGTTLYFNKLSYLNKNYLIDGEKKDSLVEIMVSQITENGWTKPKEIKIVSPFKNPFISLIVFFIIKNNKKIRA